MKTVKKLKLFSAILSMAFTSVSLAQVDKTSLINNPSFETANYNGWTWTGRNGGWQDVNADGDATKDGTYIAGYWASSIGDVECYQELTNLPSGYYQITALATVSYGRLTNQRLFANNNSALYAESTHMAYKANNINILLANSEKVSYCNLAESSAENGPFKKMAVITQVTDGRLKFGFKFSGKNTTKGYDFSHTSEEDAGFFKFDGFRLTEISSVATLENISLNFGTLNETFQPNRNTYTATLPAGTRSVQPILTLLAPGLQTVIANDVVDVSSGSGTSTITIQSIDQTQTKTYTIQYTVLSNSYEAQADGVKFFVPNGEMKVRVCTDEIIQVRYAIGTDALPTSDTIIVNRVWNEVPYTLTETDDWVSITTNKLKVTVSKTTFLVKYYDLNDNLLLSENQKIFEPNTLVVPSHTLNTNAATVVFDSPTNEALFGLGQHQTGYVNMKGKVQTIDEQNREVGLNLLVSSYGYGVLWDNYSHSVFKGDIDNNTKYHFYSDSGEMIDYYFMYGPELDHVIANYRYASGKAPMFPKWSYGLFQSKDRYETEFDLLDMVNKYRTANIPLDCIVQDWRYWEPDYWGSHTLQSFKFPDPKAMIDSLHNLNVKTMISIWPCYDSRTENYQEFDNIGAIYPNYGGTHHFYDAHNEQARKIYWEQLHSQIFEPYGWDAWWADNNEPEGYPDGFDRRDFITAKGSGLTYYNTYPIFHNAGFYAGWRKDFPNKRVFILSRSGFSGIQRYASSVWSGDIDNDWNALKTQIPAGLNFCIAGVPYWTTDIGGYWEVDWSTEANQEIFTRWLQYGTFCPLFRIHGKGNKAIVDTTVFSKNTQEHLIKFAKLRYRLMPYIYSTAWMVTNNNYTMMRHLIMDYRNDRNVDEIGDQFMFGPSMLINPVTDPSVVNRQVYLPEGQWYDFWTGKQFSGEQVILAAAPIDIIPIYVKAGGIIPMAHEIMYANQPTDSLEIRVYRGADGEFVLYEDDGETNEYETGSYSQIPFTYNEANKQLTIGARIGNFNGLIQNRIFKVVFVDEFYGVDLNFPLTCSQVVHYNGDELIVTYQPQTVAQTHYEAEEAMLTGTATVATNYAGFVGTGFVSGMNTNAKVTFKVHVPKKGLYAVKLRYSANQNFANRNLSMQVNNTHMSAINLAATKNWTVWGVYNVIVELNAGENTIAYTATANTDVHLDCIDITVPIANAYHQAQTRTVRIKQFNGNKYITLQNNTLSLEEKNDTQNQYWKIEQVEANRYRVTSLLNGNVLTVNNASTEPGASIEVTTEGGINPQKWLLENYHTNVVKLIAAHSNMLVTNANLNVVQNPLENTTDQIWILEDQAKITDYVYEPFDYPLGSYLSLAGDNNNGWAGPWSVFEGDGKDMIITEPINNTNVSTIGNRLSTSFLSGTALRATRKLAQKWTDNGQAIWISFLLEINIPDGNLNNWIGISLCNADDERILIGKNYAERYLGIIEAKGVGENLSNVSGLSLDQSWIVVKIETSGNSSKERAYMWINPNVNEIPLVANANVATWVNLNSGFDKVMCHLGDKVGITAAFDEIKIAKSFEAITSSKVPNITNNTNTNFNAFFNKQNSQIELNYIADKTEKADLILFDITGKTLYKQNIKVNPLQNYFYIDTKKLNITSGVYFVTLHTNTRVVSTKILAL